MNRSMIALLMALPSLALLAGCGGDAVASSASATEATAPTSLQGPRILSAVQALDYCDAFMGWEKIECLDRVAEGRDPSQLARR